MSSIDILLVICNNNHENKQEQQSTVTMNKHARGDAILAVGRFFQGGLDGLGAIAV